MKNAHAKNSRSVILEINPTAQIKKKKKSLKIKYQRKRYEINNKSKKINKMNKNK